MLFSSVAFFLFFAAYLPVHFLVPARYRVAVVIIGSTIFYAYWNVAYVWVPYGLIAIALFGSRFIAASANELQRRRRLVGVLALTLAPLVFFKYTNFIVASLLGPLAAAP